MDFMDPYSIVFDVDLYVDREPPGAIEEVRTALKPFCGGQVQVWTYNVGHNWLSIRLTRLGIPGNLHLFCGVCCWVAFDPCYQDSKLEVSEGPDPDGNVLFHVRDGERLLVRCFHLAVKRDVEPVFRSLAIS